VSIPAREVGGDFFNYFALPDGRLALLVGDVSGKGVSAALLMANVQATLRARFPHETELARLADGLDREIDANTPRGVYLTLFLGILDVEGGLLRYVNAGHNPQFLLGARGGIQPLSSTGLPIGLYSGQGYRESQVEIGGKAEPFDDATMMALRIEDGESGGERVSPT
jgi:sigma-B regulation protein RsbU (phosphoserine phosphatase)